MIHFHPYLRLYREHPRHSCPERHDYPALTFSLQKYSKKSTLEISSSINYIKRLLCDFFEHIYAFTEAFYAFGENNISSPSAACGACGCPAGMMMQSPFCGSRDVPSLPVSAAPSAICTDTSKQAVCPIESSGAMTVAFRMCLLHATPYYIMHLKSVSCPRLRR